MGVRILKVGSKGEDVRVIQNALNRNGAGLDPDADYGTLTRDAVIKLKPGQYSPIVILSNPANKQVMGFRIVKLVSKEPAGQRDLLDPRVQQAIRSQLHDRREQLLKAAYYEVLRDSAKVENYYAKTVLDSNGLTK